MQGTETNRHVVSSAFYNDAPVATVDEGLSSGLTRQGVLECSRGLARIGVDDPRGGHTALQDLIDLVGAGAVKAAPSAHREDPHDSRIGVALHGCGRADMGMWTDLCATELGGLPITERELQFCCSIVFSDFSKGTKYNMFLTNR